MATSSIKAILTMETDNGDKNFTYSDVLSSATVNAIKTLGTALVTNGSIFTNVPSALKAAQLVTTTVQDYELS